MKQFLLVATFFFVLFALCLSFRCYDKYFRDYLKITFLDVGQGDAVLLEFSKGKTLLVDAGGGTPRFPKAKLIIPELRAKGIFSLDAVLLTHPDSDHILGFNEIADNVSVKEYWINHKFVENVPVPLLWQVLWKFQQRHVKPQFISSQTDFNWENVEMKLIPAKGEGENNQCLVLQLHYAGCSILLTGDIEADGEASVLRLVDSNVNILKVAHHGSRTSSTKSFLRKTLPDWSVVSVGWANRYGHPKDFVLERLRAIGSEVLRTDWHGFVEFDIDASGVIQCRTARSFCGSLKCQAL